MNEKTNKQTSTKKKNNNWKYRWERQLVKQKFFQNNYRTSLSALSNKPTQRYRHINVRYDTRMKKI